jgi:hypothetical protein
LSKEIYKIGIAMTLKLTGDLFQSIDEMNTEKFVSFISENGVFIFGNSPEVCGRKNIFEAVDGFFKSIKAINHFNIKSVSTNETLIVYGTSKYTRYNDTELETPFCNVMDLKDGLISRYQIYIDLSQLY